MFNLHGIYAPIPTPFAEGKIAYDRLEENLRFWLESDLAGIVVMGSNGEFVLLTPQEKEELMRFVCVRAKGKKPVIAGTGAESTAETIRLNEKAAEAGADAVLVVTPNYYKGEMTDPVLARFYRDVADASPLPVILYNMPRNAGINISAKLAVELAKHPNIIGIKDSGGNIVQIADIIRNAPADFSVFAGSASFLSSSGKTNSSRRYADLLSPVQFRMVSTSAFHLGLKPVTYKSNQLAFAPLMCPPEFLIRNLVDAIPNRLIDSLIGPIRPKIPFI